MNRQRRHAIVLLCLVSVLPGYSFAFLSYSATTQSENSSFLKYEVNGAFVGKIKHTILIDNPYSHRVGGGELFVLVVRNETPRHYAILYNISSPIGQPTFLRDGSGNMYACWSNITIGGNQAFSVEINYYVLSFSSRYLINSSMVMDYNKSSDLYRKYTQPEELIQSNDPKIVSKAQDLTSDKSDIHEKVSEIYNFVIEHLQYEEQTEERGALWALENEIGDCSEYSYLFVALCRAAGIPARVQAGFAFNYVGETLKDGHMWAEYYLENYGWIPVDATWELFDTLDYRHFGSIQSMPVTPYANYVLNNTVGPEPRDKQTVRLEPFSSTFFGESFAENISKVVQKVKETKFALFLANVFGATLIFSPEAEKTKQTLLESQVGIQNAIDSWEDSPQIAQSNAANALESAEEAARCAWMLIVKTLIPIVSILAVIVLTTLFFMKRYTSKLKEKTQNGI